MNNEIDWQLEASFLAFELARLLTHINTSQQACAERVAQAALNDFLKKKDPGQ